MQIDTTSSLGKVLASDNGKGNGAITQYFVVGGVGSAVIVGVCILPQQTSTVIGVVGLLILVSYVVFAARYAASTNITVYENGITGGGGGRGYYLTFELRNFNLTYDKVTSVDASEYSVIIYAGCAQYRCYAKNPAEIQRIILEQQRKIQT